MSHTTHGQDVGVLIKLIHDRLEVLANKHLKQFDLTLSQIRVLGFLRDRQGGVSSQKDIQAYLKVSHPTVVGLLNRLESKGFVVCEIDANDRRMKNVSLSQKEARIGAYMEASKDEMERMLMKGLDGTEIALLRRLLRVVYRNIEEAG